MMTSKLQLRTFLLTVLFVLTALSTIFPVAVRAADDYLEPDKAFHFSAEMTNPHLVSVTYQIADKYYMYRERFKVQASGATLGMPNYPAGKIKFDETFQKNVETYRHAITFTIPVEGNGPFKLTVTGQGCADAGLCYAPMDSEITLSPTGSVGLLAVAREALTANSAAPPASSSPSLGTANSSATTNLASQDSDSSQIDTALKSGRLLLILPLFLLLGLGLSFTPCVLPMLPILSSIIVGEGVTVRRRRALLLSATYAFGMAIVYTALGIAAGLIGEGLSAALQNAWVLSSFAVIMALLALSMFGVYHLQVPVSLQHKLMAVSNRGSAGKLFGVFVMGALSALIVGPCVAAPLAGALVYISQSHNVLIGGAALFALATGMSVPLLLIGVSAGSLLPRAGVWMDQVTRFFGVLMLIVAWWMVSPVIPAVVQMLGWALLGIGYGVFLLGTHRAGWFARTVGLLFAVLGVIQLVGVATGGRDALAPLAHLSSAPKQAIKFNPVASSAQLDTTLANHSGQLTMLDFYADWCVSCKEMEKLTFTEPAVRSQLDAMLLLRADVTANNADDRALLKRFHLFGPPGIVFFRNGIEIPGTRIIGFQSSDKFLKSLAAMQAH